MFQCYFMQTDNFVGTEFNYEMVANCLHDYWQFVKYSNIINNVQVLLYIDGVGWGFKVLSLVGCLKTDYDDWMVFKNYWKLTFF